MSNLYLMMGCPGAGKSAWLKKYIAKDLNSKIVSRDQIRFSLVEENEEYFSHEKQVYNDYIYYINNWLRSDFDVYADATHLNVASRRKLLNHIYVETESISIIYIKTPLFISLEQNKKREGTRAYVPESQLRRMYYQIEEPTFEEGFDNIYIVEPNKTIQIKRRG